MIVLGIDTASTHCAVTVLSPDGVIATRSSSRPRAHAELLMGMIDECMGAAGRRKPDTVAVSGGPGSFTGLRIGFSVAKGISSALGSALVVVPTFEAWALAAAGSPGAAGGSTIMTVMSAGRGEAFLATFLRSAGGVTALSGPSLVPTGDLGRIAAEGKSALIVGETRDRLEEWFPSGSTAAFISLADDGIDIAGGVARIGMRRAASGMVSDPATAEPVYGRDFSTTPPKEEKGVR
jgi:tRNA threonylcarbamoyladenosine biosynthesis protein TsaB